MRASCSFEFTPKRRLFYLTDRITYSLTLVACDTIVTVSSLRKRSDKQEMDFPKIARRQPLAVRRNRLSWSEIRNI